MYRWQNLTTVAALTAAFTSTTAVAQSPAPLESFYGGVSVGTATYFDQGNLEYDYLGYVIAGQAGFRILPDLRVEGEIAYESTSAEIDLILVNDIDVDVTAFRGSASAYYDFNTIAIGGLVPYGGGGLGITVLDADSGLADADDTELSAHLEGGASMKLGSNLDLVPAARWELTDDASNFQLRIGARFWL